MGATAPRGREALARWIPGPEGKVGLRRRRRGVWLVPALLGLLLGWSAGAEEVIRNGFVLAPASVPVEEILRGGPPRDGIPALDHPRQVPPEEAGFADDAVVLGVVLGGEARAYPVSILNHHELVNDTVGGQPILVSFCPLCGTGLVFDRRVDDRVLTFGVSGLLYLSDLLMYDRDTESLWSQVKAAAVTGPLLGSRLDVLRARMMRLDDWRREHPGTTVLSRDTGHRRNYGQNPYATYAGSEELMFPVPLDRRYHPKMPTLGLRLAGGEARAYPAAELVRAGGEAKELFAGHLVRVAYDNDRQVFDFRAPEEVEVIEGFWFAWAAFHPETSVFQGTEADSRSDHGDDPKP
jgi:hypothetical protein